MNVCFGFVPLEYEWSVGDYRITPVDDFRKRVERVLEEANEQDGFHYPKQCFTATCLESHSMITRPRSRHIEPMYKLPGTHRISFVGAGPEPPEENFRRGEGALLIHGLAWLFRLRCQFEDLWFEGRVPTKERPVCVMNTTDVNRVLQGMLGAFGAWGVPTRSRFPSAMLVKARSASQLWPSDKFTGEYTVFDALYRCWLETQPGWSPQKKDSTRHQERFRRMGDAGLIHWDSPHPAEASMFVLFRNELIHEGLWLGGSPLSGAFHEGYLHLAQLNDRFILSLTGINCSFRRTPWMGMTQHVLGLPSQGAAASP